MGSTGIEEWLAASGHDRPLRDRTSVPERIASLLRQMIMDGAVRPGDRLSDDELSDRLATSRNTVREAFRLLGHDGLLEHRLNRGVFIRQLTAADVTDIYDLRHLIEGAAVRQAATAPPTAIATMADQLRLGDAAAAAGRWAEVGTVNIHFHENIARLLCSPRADAIMQRLLAELRLAFLVRSDPDTFHGPYLPRNWEILQLLQDGDLGRAEAELRQYLTDAEQQLLIAFEQPHPGGATPPAAGGEPPA